MFNRSPGLSRREFIAGSGVLSALGVSRSLALAAKSLSLGEIAGQKGILFGSALRGAGLKDPLYATLFREQCAIVVPEGALKWGMLRPAPASFDFSGGDWLLDFASRNRMKFRGHTLIWDGDLPPWFEPTMNSRNAAKMTVDHISTVVKHYAGKMTSWDVVNEGVQAQDGRADGLKENPWLKALGPGYIDLAFRTAHEADPEAMLVYNESWLEPEDTSTERRRQAVLSLLSRLKARGVPVHALGIQSHIFAEAGATGRNFRRFLEEVSDMGLAILITELDVRDQHLPANVAQRDRKVADQYYNYLSFMLQFESVKTVLTWGLTGRYTWIAKNNPRSDGLPVRPLPYDENYRPTPSWEAIERAFQEASPR